MPSPLPVVLIVLDGWGIAPEGPGNAVALSRPAFLERLRRSYPYGQLQAAGEAVGLPRGFIGNSEVGHLCLGSGRTILQDLLRIDRAIASGALDGNQVIGRALAAAAAPGASLHLMGLLSDGGVHSHIDHLEALVRLARARALERVRVHAFLDGRDTPPKSGLSYIARAEDFLKRIGLGGIATVSGRYYAMDRDNRWDRIEKAWRALVRREGSRFPSAAAAVEAGYASGVTDEFIEPAVIETPATRDGGVRDGDAVLFFNFRADRARQLTRAFTQPGFDGFPTGARPALGAFVCFTRYDDSFALPVAFPPQRHTGLFGEAVSAAGLAQLRIAETEKYAHVTYFFNGGEERAFAGEERCLVPSWKGATYDLKPEMSAPEVTAELLRRLVADPRRVVVLNYANADMVGHTGRLEPTIAACRTVDAEVEQVVTETLRLGGAALVTADHGNAEEMLDAAGGPVTAHTRNPVPVHLAAPGLEGRRIREQGLLADVAPTLLEILGLPQPKEMEGRSLLRG
jgi:2,3-bisphosphoglycerate-independent phosphoglycerate mutase